MIKSVVSNLGKEKTPKYGVDFEKNTIKGLVKK